MGPMRGDVQSGHMANSCGRAPGRWSYASGEGGTTSATDFPKSVIRRGLLVFRTRSSRARHLALNSEMATSSMVSRRLLNYVMVTTNGHRRNKRTNILSTSISFRNKARRVLFAVTPQIRLPVWQNHLVDNLPGKREFNQ